ncbi:MAG TPA: hypothetical protein VMG10_29230 [Gemmataceae bacterium]|nr:hypothetical protein [Gemmataceae bacterium]
MDLHDDPPLIDARRLRRWTDKPPPSGERPCDVWTMPRAVITAFGGELPFWLAWLRGELDADLQAWFRQQAEHDPPLLHDLRSIEQPHGSGYSTRAARTEVRDALEAMNYLTEAHARERAALSSLLAGHEEEQTETDLALLRQGTDRKGERSRPANQTELRRRIRSGLFALLEEVEIRVPAAEEVSQGTRLLEHLVGPPAITRFVHLHALPARIAKQAPSLRFRLVQEMAPALFVREEERFRNRLSFRSFLRGRLQYACRRRGWLPAGPRYRDLTSAFAALSRDRIGTLVRGLLAGREVFQTTGVPCEQLATLLEAAP